MKKKQILIGAAVLVAIVAWFVAASLFGPKSEHWVKHEVSRLQKDSIALQADFRPRGSYSFVSDILEDVDTIKDLGKPLRFGNTELDSTHLFECERTAAIANYNIAKCDSVLSDVLPLWRSTAILTLGSELKAKEPNTIVRTNSEMPNYTGIKIYSIRYLNKDAMDDDAKKYNYILGELGFKSVVYAVSSESIEYEYTFK